MDHGMRVVGDMRYHMAVVVEDSKSCGDSRRDLVRYMFGNPTDQAIEVHMFRIRHP